MTWWDPLTLSSEEWHCWWLQPVDQFVELLFNLAKCWYWCRWWRRAISLVACPSAPGHAYSRHSRWWWIRWSDWRLVIEFIPLLLPLSKNNSNMFVSKFSYYSDPRTGAFACYVPNNSRFDFVQNQVIGTNCILTFWARYMRFSSLSDLMFFFFFWMGYTSRSGWSGRVL